jgi:hypothetical protein
MELSHQRSGRDDLIVGGHKPLRSAKNRTSAEKEGRVLTWMKSNEHVARFSKTLQHRSRP